MAHTREIVDRDGEPKRLVSVNFVGSMWIENQMDPLSEEMIFVLKITLLDGTLLEIHRGTQSECDAEYQSWKTDIEAQ